MKINRQLKNVNANYRCNQGERGCEYSEMQMSARWGVILGALQFQSVFAHDVAQLAEVLSRRDI
jgi:hypothetical protein